MSMRGKIRDLRNYAEAANDEHQVRLRTGQLADLSDRLDLPAKDLPALKIGFAEVRQLNVEIPPGLDQDAVRAADGLRDLAEELPAMAVDTSLDLAKVQVRNAEKFAVQVRALVADAWQQHVRQPLPPINNELVDALARGGVDVESVRDSLENAQGQLLAIANRTIPREGDVDKFIDAFESLRACGDQIATLVDPEIAAGILGAQEESGMPLAWFTAERTQALTDLGIIDRFRVRLQ